jgi:uncharacterized protein YndB with AHSA1/START domain
VATARRRFAVGAEQVWRVLADGRRYRDWVVGTGQIRDVDADWPSPGANLHYTVGRRPLVKRDRTEVRAAEPGRMLELEANAWPAGSARIRIELTPLDAGGCEVAIQEHPLRGPAAMVHNPVLDLLLGVRLHRMLRLLGQCAAEPAGQR